MIKLYGFGPAFGIVDASPFVVKVDLFLRINDIEFEIVAGNQYVQKAPKGKLPFIEDQGAVIGDSAFILDHLSKQHGVDMDSWLSESQRASAYLITKSLEENFYWCRVYSNWVDNNNWPISREAFFGSLPTPVNYIVAPIVRRGVTKQLKAQGIARHSDTEILDIGKRSLDAISNLLGEQETMFGNRISSLDIAVYAMIATLCLENRESELGNLVKGYANLNAFAHRIHDQYY